MTPKVSVIIPVYNVEEYLEQCLDSVLNQTLREVEIICINDGSTDSSLELLKKFALKDSRIKIIDKKNEGPSAARNEGIKTAAAPYILFFDADDYLEHNALEEAFKCAENSDVALVCFRVAHARRLAKFHVLMNGNGFDDLRFQPLFCGEFFKTHEIGVFPRLSHRSVVNSGDHAAHSLYLLDVREWDGVVLTVPAKSHFHKPSASLMLRYDMSRARSDAAAASYSPFSQSSPR